MAPKPHDEDDFVLTISDNEGSLPYEEEDDTPANGADAPANGLKRKREDEDVAENHKITNGLSKRQKKGKKKKKEKPKDKGDADFEGPEVKNKIGEVRGDDDGEIDSDFEFDVGGAHTGVVEDFDGWGMEDDIKDPPRQEPKKGVDIDELVARRKGRKGENGRVNGSSHAHSDEEQGAPEDHGNDASANGDSDEDMEANEQGAEAHHGMDDSSEDELMAADGFGMGATDLNDDDEEDNEDYPGPPDSTSEDESVASPVPHPLDEASDGTGDDSDDDEEEQARRDAFFAPEPELDKKKTTKTSTANSFQSMSLSRPILRGLASVGFSDPTPIQAKTIPVALLGKDVVGGAVTGSGKTAAFMIPILERLLYRPKKVPTSRVAILMPTRELAVQCFNVAKKLASFTDVTFCQLVGGFSLREQESVLRTRPDIIIATPGRFIDHMRNSASFTVDTLEILVLDEADRMLEDGFADELNEILTTIPKSRQTMLFSATMTSSVDNLIRVGLNRPVRLLVDAQKQTVGTLVQEFVRLRVGREDKRLAYLMHLVTTVYTDRCIVFFRQKKEAHRVRVIFSLFGLKAAELHGSMSQEQRISAIESFRAGTATHLLATDVASRGLDIKNVSSVLNYEAPQSHSIYLHRVGRTARAGRTGRACTLAAEPDRKVVKQVVKASKSQKDSKIVSRLVEADKVEEWVAKLRDAEKDVEEVLAEEKQEKALAGAEMHVRKGENMLQHEAEIMARPKRTWFESEADKKAAKLKGKVELNGLPPANGTTKLKVGGLGGGKLSGKQKKLLDDRRERKEGKVWKKGKGERGAGPTSTKIKVKPNGTGAGGGGSKGKKGKSSSIKKGAVKGKGKKQRK